MDGVLSRRAGRLQERWPGAVLPCASCPKIPREAPARDRRYAVELSDRNRAAFRHWRECKAVGRWPEDSIVRRNAALIQQVFDDHEAGVREGLGRKIDQLGEIILLGLGLKRG